MNARPEPSRIDLSRGFELFKRIRHAASEDSVVELVFEAALGARCADRCHLVRPSPSGVLEVVHRSSMKTPPAAELEACLEAARAALARPYRPEPPDAAVLARLLAWKERVLGVLVAVKEGGERFSAADQRSFTRIARHASHGMHCRNPAPSRPAAEPAAPTAGRIVPVDTRLEEERTRVRTRRLNRSEIGDLSARSPEIVGTSAARRRLLEAIVRFAASDLPVVICGEAGTGKEVIARAIHRASARAKGPFVPVDTAALPEELVAAELFGDEAHAIEGVLRGTGGGTVFLDEVGELPVAVQPELARALQGGGVRVVAATSQPLKQLVAEGRFREDLYYRLSALELTVPPLRERREDLRALVAHFTKAASSRRPGFRADAWTLIEAHPFPGNVGQLRRAVERALAVGNDPIRPGDLGLDLERPDVVHEEPVADRKLRFQKTVDELGGNLLEAAKVLGCHQNTVARVLGLWGG